MSCLEILDINPLSVASFAKIFSHSEGCLFISFMVSFAVHRLLSFTRPHLFYFYFFKLFIYLWLCWVFVSVQGLSPVAASGGHSSSRCAGLSLSQPLLLRSTGSRCAGSVSCGSRAQSLRGMWDLPRPGLEPVSPTLAGRFSTTAPPGKP